MHKLFLLVISGLLSFTLSAQSNRPLPLIDFKVVDKTPQFLRFYDSATRKNAGEAERWSLWKSMYDFAAVPPTPQGDSMARNLLNGAWSRYAQHISLLRKGAETITPGARKMLSAIADLLQPDSALNITLLAYVGGFEGNAFNTARNGRVTLAVAIETPQPKRTVIMAHEMTHAVHIGMGSMSGDWKRTVGAIVISEGLALHASKKILPNASDKAITEHVPGWLAKAGARRTAILKNILPFIFSDQPDDVMRFTMAKGPAGLEREAYYTGWVVVGYLLNHGMSFSQIARIPEKEMPTVAQKAIESILNTQK